MSLYELFIDECFEKTAAAVSRDYDIPGLRRFRGGASTMLRGLGGALVGGLGGGIAGVGGGAPFGDDAAAAMGIGGASVGALAGNLIGQKSGLRRSARGIAKDLKLKGLEDFDPSLLRTIGRRLGTRPATIVPAVMSGGFSDPFIGSHEVGASLKNQILDRLEEKGMLNQPAIKKRPSRVSYLKGLM